MKTVFTELDVYGKRLIRSILEDGDGELDLIGWARYTLNRIGHQPDYNYPETDPAAVFAYCLLLARSPDEVKDIAARPTLENEKYAEVLKA